MTPIRRCRHPVNTRLNSPEQRKTNHTTERIVITQELRSGQHFRAPRMTQMLFHISTCHVVSMSLFPRVSLTWSCRLNSLARPLRTNAARETSVSQKGPPDRQFTRSMRGQTVQARFRLCSEDVRNQHGDLKKNVYVMLIDTCIN